MTGTKIFISGGDHDLTDNIIHMVIAKIPDENGQIHDDLSTVNFFMVPKFLVGEDGKMGARNGVSTGGIEKKMGIKAQATCVLNFDDATAWRLGPKPTPPKPGEKRSASRRHGRHVRHDERRAAGRRHPGHLHRRGRLPERLSPMRMSAASATR